MEILGVIPALVCFFVGTMAVSNLIRAREVYEETGHRIWRFFEHAWAIGALAAYGGGIYVAVKILAN